MGKYIMALDQGTTSSRTILFNHDGEVVKQVSKEYRQIFPQPGWVEHDPMDIWESQKWTMLEVLKEADVSPSDVDAIGITNQRETTIVWDKNTGEPIYNAIVWQCRRTSEMVDELSDKLESEGKTELIPSKTGLRPDAYFSGTKIKWILDNVEGAYERAKNGELLFGTVDTWLMWNLSAGEVHATDYTNASRTMLFNIHDLDWDDELLELLDVPKPLLPKAMKSSGLFGYASKELLGEKIPIMGVAGDQQAALFGQCCFEDRDIKNTYGTGGFLMMNTGNKPVTSKNGLLTTIAASTDDIQYALEGSVFVSGSAIQWLRDAMKMVETAPQSEEIASKVSDTDGVYVVPAFTGLGAPYWEQDARGVAVGLTRGTTKEHFVRATLESLAFQTNDVLTAMEEDAGEIKTIKVDGGACLNNFLLQFQSDISNKEVVRPTVIETTGLGAAYLAGLASGYWSDKEELKSHSAVDRVFKPEMSTEKSEELIKGWKKAVDCAISYSK